MSPRPRRQRPDANALPPWFRRFPTPTTAQAQVTKRHPPPSNQQFEPLPAPTGKAPYRMQLADVLTSADLEAIAKAGHLRFHCVGDTGGIQKGS